MPETKLTTRDLLKLLRERYAHQKWAFVEQVPDGTGIAKGRTADAMVMGLWRSVGIYLHGFEVKVSRGDWLRELQSPEKSQGFVDACDFWWIVAVDGIVRLEELPAHWGLLAATKKGTSLSIRRPATRNPAPVPVSRDLLAATFRVIARKAMSDPERAAAVEEGEEAAEARLRAEMERVKAEADRRIADAKELITNFEKAAGVELRWWNTKDIAKAAAILSNQLPDQVATRYDNLAEELGRLATQLRHTASQLRPPQEAAVA